MEKPDVLFLQENKCSFETMLRIGLKIWKGSRVIAIDETSMGGDNSDAMGPKTDRSLELEGQPLLLRVSLQIFRLWGFEDPS